MQTVWSCWVCLGQVQIKCSHNVRRFQITVVELESSNVMRTVWLCWDRFRLCVRITSEDSRLLLQNWNLLTLCEQSGYVGFAQVRLRLSVRITSEDSILLLQNWNLLTVCEQSGYVGFAQVRLGVHLIQHNLLMLCEKSGYVRFSQVRLGVHLIQHYIKSVRITYKDSSHSVFT